MEWVLDERILRILQTIDLADLSQEWFEKKLTARYIRELEIVQACLRFKKSPMGLWANAEKTYDSA